MLSSLPNVNWLLGDRGYDADWFTELSEMLDVRFRNELLNGEIFYSLREAQILRPLHNSSFYEYTLFYSMKTVVKFSKVTNSNFMQRSLY